MKPSELNRVGLLIDFPDRNLRRGEVGTVVQELDATHVQVEFADHQGVSYAFLDVVKKHLLVLHEVHNAQIAA